tara:strand:- start:33109 stop:33567 length:459 start_codon:yes stop_codon:yes gene_type:complete
MAKKREVTKDYVKDAKSKKVVRTTKRGTTTTERISQYNKGYLGRLGDEEVADIPYGDKNLWEKRFKSKVNKEGEETKRKEKIIYDDGNQMKKRKQKKIRFGKNKGKIRSKTVHWKDGKKTVTKRILDKTDVSKLKKGGFRDSWLEPPCCPEI